jgi:hypothetical protein
MLFDIPFIADWKQIGDYRQCQTDCSNKCGNNKCDDFDYKVGNKVIIKKMVSFAKQSPYENNNHGL